MAAKLPTWQVGDSVYSLRLDPITGRHRVHGEGRVVRIESGTLHLATTKGPKTWAATSWPAFKTRAEGEAYVAENPTPQGSRGQMAHYGPSTAATEEKPPDSGVTNWQCGRCLWLAEGRIGEEIPDHARQCRYRGRGDPEQNGYG
jgi:hypothetical protein